MPYPFQLPARLVIATIVHKLASISVSTIARLFVILADVWLIIKSHSGSDMLTRTQWPMCAPSFFAPYCVLAPEALLIIGIAVQAFVKSLTINSLLLCAAVCLLQHLLSQSSVNSRVVLVYSRCAMTYAVQAQGRWLTLHLCRAGSQSPELQLRPDHPVAATSYC